MDARIEPALREWTIAAVKAELPRVPVLVGRKVHWARVSGRANAFATVTLSYVENAGPREHLYGAPWADFQVAWATLVHALNSGRPIRV